MRKISLLFMVPMSLFSEINNLDFVSENMVDNTLMGDNAYLTQGTLSLEGGAVTQSNLLLNSSVKDATVNHSNISQSEVSIDHASIGQSEIRSSSSLDHQVSNSIVVQSKLHLSDNSSIQSSVININATIEKSLLEDSKVTQCSVYLRHGASLSGSHVTSMCHMQNSQIVNGADLTQGSIFFKH